MFPRRLAGILDHALIMDALSEEVWRIVTAPYAVSLQVHNSSLKSNSSIAFAL